MEMIPLSCELPEKAGFANCNSRTVERWCNGALVHGTDQVAEEVPVAMVYNGIPYVVMLATPSRLKQFGFGFSLSEGILYNRSELHDIKVVQRREGIELEMAIAQNRFAELGQRRRNLEGRTGCGLCGTESLQQVQHPLHPVPAGQSFRPETVQAALRGLLQMQPLYVITGAVHAAAWVMKDGTIAHVEEDVGRHNALDKLIGTLVENGSNFSEGFVIVTSRASYEMVQKAATVGIPMLVAVSAATGLAVDLAQKTGLTLVGFARDDRHVIYTHSQRFINHQVYP